MNLLNASKPAELPTDALLARLRGRRAEIHLFAESADVSSRAVTSWVYRRLNRQLRQRLKPFLDLLAMRNLVLALRYTLVGETPVPALLNDSLLDEPFIKLLTSDKQADVVVSQLEAMLVGNYPFASGLYQKYRSQGPGGVEQQLAEGILQHSLAIAGDPCLVRVFRYLVDLRNLVTVNKLWRWQVKRMPGLREGGDISAEALQRVWSARDEERLARLASKRAGLAHAASSAIRMEQLLLKGLTKLLQRNGRDPLSLAVIVEYLWLAQVAQHNQVLRENLSRDRETLLEEVLLT